MGRPKLNKPAKPKLTLTPSQQTCDWLKEMSADQHISSTAWLEDQVSKEYKKFLRTKKKQAPSPDQISLLDEN